MAEDDDRPIAVFRVERTPADRFGTFAVDGREYVVMVFGDPQHGTGELVGVTVMSQSDSGGCAAFLRGVPPGSSGSQVVIFGRTFEIMGEAHPNGPRLLVEGLRSLGLEP